MAHTVLVVRGHISSAVANHQEKQTRYRMLADFLKGFAGGVRSYASTLVVYNAIEATGTVSFVGSSGTVGATINGTLVTVAFTTSATVTGDLFVAAVAAAAGIVSDHVTATNAAGVVTLTAKYPGPAGNAITLALSGTGVTVSGARLTGGAGTQQTGVA